MMYNKSIYRRKYERIHTETNYELKANPYTLNVTKNKLYFTAKFKEDFWISYQAGNAPRKILLDFDII